MWFVIASPRLFLTNRLSQPSDAPAEQDISKTGVRLKHMEVELLSKGSEVLLPSIPRRDHDTRPDHRLHR